jgi:ATP-dependent RNA helicase DOB1
VIASWSAHPEMGTNNKGLSTTYFPQFCGVFVSMKCSQECGIELDEEKYVARFTPNLMVPLYTWASGASFADITKDTSIFEGTLIRCTRRLMELFDQIIYAADQVGETEMKEQMSKALKSLQRGIMYCGSLYL